MVDKFSGVISESGTMTEMESFLGYWGKLKLYSGENLKYLLPLPIY
jgi:hypothetical protein